MPIKSFREWLPGQPLLLPTDLRRWLPDDHLVWFVLELVDRLDISRIADHIHAKDPRGAQPYDPRMMIALLMYGYAVGVFSSRRLERATYEDVAFRILTADQHPDHDTIATFRRENLTEFRELFVQVLRMAATMGLVSFGMLGLDGVKVLANASKHQAMSYDRMKKDIERLTNEIATLLARAEQVDGEEQARFGDGKIADIPAEIARREQRKAKIEEAMVALEAEAREARLAELREQAERQEAQAADPERDETARKLATTLGRKRRAAIQALEGSQTEKATDGDQGDDPPDAPVLPLVRPATEEPDEPAPDADLPSNRVPHELDGTPTDKAQRNFTDPDSRIMVRDGDHYVQAFNAQAMVDNAHQIIVGAAVGNQAPDSEYLPPMLDRVNENLANAGITKPPAIPTAADAGYYSEANVQACEERGYEPYIAPERTRRVRPELVASSRPADEAAAHGNDERGPTDFPAPSEGREAVCPSAENASPAATPSPRDRMRAKLRTPEGTRVYGLRKTTPEPVFGQILGVRGFRRFMLRGLQKVRGEWDLVTMTHNLLKLWRSGEELPAAG